MATRGRRAKVDTTALNEAFNASKDRPEFIEKAKSLGYKESSAINYFYKLSKNKKKTESEPRTEPVEETLI
jgi:hypothetical protein